MNIGQVLENHLGWAARALGMEIDDQPGIAVEKPAQQKVLRNLKQPSYPTAKLEHYGYDYEKIWYAGNC